MQYSKPFVDDPENVKDSELQLELLFTEGRMLNKDHKGYKTTDLGNVLLPSEVSQQTTTRQEKAYTYKTILCQRRREKVSMNIKPN